MGGRMLRNRIHELRTTRGWSMGSLGERLKPPVDSGQVNKIEKAGDKLDLAWINRMSEGFGCDAIEVVSDAQIERQPVGSDVERVIPDRGDPFATLISKDRELWRVQNPVLDELGLAIGAMLLIGTGEFSPSAIQTGETVIAQVGDIFLLREFVEPSLLITNSKGENARPRNLRHDGAKVIGRVLNHLRTLTPGRQ